MDKGIFGNGRLDAGCMRGVHWKTLLCFSATLPDWYDHAVGDGEGEGDVLRDLRLHGLLFLGIVR